jgi:ketosteroid isomerase-like protein
MTVGEYTDEAYSAFASSRGPGLADAMRHAQELARDATAELLAQHSDRLARGDGRSARHYVAHVEDGKITRWRPFLSHQEALKAVGLEE